MATLRINLTKVGNACDQDPTRGGNWPAGGWYVFVNDCHNQPFTKAGKEYAAFPVNHGYVEVKDVPPGRYLVFAISNPFIVTPLPGESIFQSNYASHFAVVDVCCNCEDLCVTLYNSGWHYCVQVILYWFELLARAKQLDPKLARPAIDALNAVVRAGGAAQPGDAAAIEQLGQITGNFGKDEDTTERQPR
jgi:hypothetical protein